MSIYTSCIPMKCTAFMSMIAWNLARSTGRVASSLRGSKLPLEIQRWHYHNISVESVVIWTSLGAVSMWLHALCERNVWCLWLFRSVFELVPVPKRQRIILRATNSANHENTWQDISAILCFRITFVLCIGNYLPVKCYDYAITVKTNDYHYYVFTPCCNVKGIRWS